MVAPLTITKDELELLLALLSSTAPFTEVRFTESTYEPDARVEVGKFMFTEFPVAKLPVQLYVCVACPEYEYSN